MKSKNGDYIIKIIESIKDEEFNYFEENNINNIFDTILSFFIELLKKNMLFYSNEIFIQNSKKLTDLLILIGNIYFNFNYKKEFTPDFIFISKIISELNNLKKDDNNSLFIKFHKNLFNYENSELFKKLYLNKSKLNSKKLSISIFPSNILEFIISSESSDKLISLFLENNYEYIDHINYLLNNPQIKSLYSNSNSNSNFILFSNISINYFHCNNDYNNNIINYVYEDKKFLIN
jgi:hypothetical protein